MRVLHINCNYLGTTLHQLMIEELDALGIENEVFVPTFDKNAAVIKPNQNVYVSECFRKWDRLLFDYKQSKILKAIEERYDVAKYDLIHAYTLFTDGNAARVLSEKYGVPYVVAVRNTDVNDFFKKMIFLRNRGVKNLNAAQKIFFLSETYKETVLNTYVPQTMKAGILERSLILPNGIHDFWHENITVHGAIDPGEKIKLLYVGTVDKNKNITATQKARELLASRGVDTSFTVIGRITAEDEYKKVMRTPDTTYLPPKNKEELIGEYRKHDIFVMPSIHETFGLVYAEAMSQGVPVIYTRGQGFDKQFPDGMVGYPVDSSSASEIAASILRIVDNYAELSSNCSQCVKKYRWNLIADQYRGLYEEICESAKGHR